MQTALISCPIPIGVCLSVNFGLVNFAFARYDKLLEEYENELEYRQLVERDFKVNSRNCLRLYDGQHVACAVGGAICASCVVFCSCMSSFKLT